MWQGSLTLTWNGFDSTSIGLSVNYFEDTAGAGGVGSGRQLGLIGDWFD